MSFIQRDLLIRIQLDGSTFDNGASSVELRGLRCEAVIQNAGGRYGTFARLMQLRIAGMLPADLAKLSTLGFTQWLYRKNVIEVYAVDSDIGKVLVFAGGIYSGSINYNAMPDVMVDIFASTAYDSQLRAIAGSSYNGSMDVATMLQALAAQAGYAFDNSAGVSVKLSNHVATGSLLDQISEICSAADVVFDIKPGVPETLVIWPRGKTRDEQVIEVSAATGMVGYPEYTMNGAVVRSLFNPQIEFGRKVNVVTSIPNFGANAQRAAVGLAPQQGTVPGAPGVYYVWTVTHELSANLPNGPWFTSATIGDSGIVGT